MNRKPDTYFSDGCGRCKLGGTPECKVHAWAEELKKLRAILLSCGLTEESKWGFPCYTFEKRNVVLLGAFKEYCAVGFIKGALLKDAKGLLVKPGENTQTVRQLRFTSLREIVKMESVVKAYVAEAMEVEKSGSKPAVRKEPEPVPAELQTKLDEIPALKAAFDALTPGRRRGYVLYFSAAKQSKTREARIEKCMPQILKGKGFYD